MAEIGRRKVWAVTSAERGRTHTVLTYINASDQSLPPMIIFPRKRMKDNLKNGALPGTMFACSESGWINQSLFLDWLIFYYKNFTSQTSSYNRGWPFISCFIRCNQTGKRQPHLFTLSSISLYSHIATIRCGSI